MADNVYPARPAVQGEPGAAGQPVPSARASASARQASASPLDGGVFIAATITLAALLIWALTQTWLLIGERGGLERTAGAQQQQIDAANKVRAQLDAIASGMQRLADGGNASARVVVEELRKRGVTINVNAAPPAGAK